MQLAMRRVTRSPARERVLRIFNVDSESVELRSRKTTRNSDSAIRNDTERCGARDFELQDEPDGTRAVELARGRRVQEARVQRSCAVQTASWQVGHETDSTRRRSI